MTFDLRYPLCTHAVLVIAVQQGINKFSNIVDGWSYTFRKNPASGRHFTKTSEENRARKSSQCSRVARPPAEQPVSKAWRATDHFDQFGRVEFVRDED